MPVERQALIKARVLGKECSSMQGPVSGNTGPSMCLFQYCIVNTRPSVLGMDALEWCRYGTKAEVKLWQVIDSSE